VIQPIAGVVPWHRSLRFRLVAAAVVVELCMLGFLLSNSYRLVNAALESQTRERIAALAPLFNAALSGYVFQRDISEVNAILKELVESRLTDIRYIAVHDSRDQTIAQAGSGIPANLGRAPAAGDAARGALSGLVYHTHVPLTLNGNPLGSVWFGLSLASMATLRDTVLQQSLAIAALEVVLSLLLLSSGSYLITRHIATLLGATRRTASGDYAARIAIAGQDEISVLAMNFNRMVDAVQTRVDELQLSKEALRESEARFRAIFDNVNDAIFVHDAETGQVLDVNQRMCEMFGFADRADALKSNLAQMSSGVPPYSMAEAMAHARQAVEAGPQTFQWHARSKQGALFWVEVSLRLSQIGAHRNVLAVVRDIGERKRAEAELQLAASVFSHAREGIMITAADATIVSVNEAFVQLTGYAQSEMVGGKPGKLRSGLHGAEFYALMWRLLLEQGHWSGEIWNRRKDGKLFAVLLTISAVHDSDANTSYYVALYSDITLIKDHERQLEQIAHYDALTGLPNRVLLADRLHLAMAQSHRRQQLLAVAYLDLDGFKQINDRHGHGAGDQLLAALAARMQQSLREGDTLARLGGDELVAVLPDLADVDASLPMIQRLLAAAAEPVNLGELCLQVSASIGVTLYPQTDDVDADQLLRQADQAMYQAKLAGKNRHHFFDFKQDRNLRGHHESLAEIRRALAADQFVLYYQPKVNMRSGTVIGAEALIRWQHPERGLVPPGEFLPVIEDHPLAIELGEWVIDRALTQMAGWHAAGLAIPVSVNVGALQLQQANFVERLRVLLAAHPAIKPEWLELEVLETSALQEVAQVSRVMQACRDIGVSFALDDFGTGYSSLTYLKRLPAHVLKIDQSFVRNMPQDPGDRAILIGVLGLAQAFERVTIAEGVETMEHGLMLLKLGCELAQGYGIARPMPAEALPAWTASWRPDPRWAAAVEDVKYALPSPRN
jgi:diguanylate cyclase (GGDEF)-like protein/PAS domain S-box-containing protein